MMYYPHGNSIEMSQIRPSWKPARKRFWGRGAPFCTYPEADENNFGDYARESTQNNFRMSRCRA